MDALNQGMQDELARIRHKDATARRGSKSESAIAELEWKAQSAMISSGPVIGPIVAIAMIALIVWLVFF
jgi:hypothetical protein